MHECYCDCYHCYNDGDYYSDYDYVYLYYYCCYYYYYH